MSRTAKTLPPAMTVDDFVAWPGDGKGGKYELVDGHVRLMSPAQPTHARIQSRLARLLGNHLGDAGTRCAVLTEVPIELRIKAKTNLRVPDLAVSCAPDTKNLKALPDPLLLIEILSPSNTAETWSNVWAYTTIPSVREILILHSTEMAAELLRREANGNWPSEPEPISSDGTINLETIALDLPLIEVYRGTYLVAPEA
jgi:Uma2 family endonuclease